MNTVVGEIPIMTSSAVMYTIVPPSDETQAAFEVALAATSIIYTENLDDATIVIIAGADDVDKERARADLKLYPGRMLFYYKPSSYVVSNRASLVMKIKDPAELFDTINAHQVRIANLRDTAAAMTSLRARAAAKHIESIPRLLSEVGLGSSTSRTSATETVELSWTTTPEQSAFYYWDGTSSHVPVARTDAEILAARLKYRPTTSIDLRQMTAQAASSPRPNYYRLLLPNVVILVTFTRADSQDQLAHVARAMQHQVATLVRSDPITNVLPVIIDAVELLNNRAQLFPSTATGSEAISDATSDMNALKTGIANLGLTSKSIVSALSPLSV